MEQMSNYTTENINTDAGNIRITRSINGTPVSKNELLNEHIISDGGAMSVILAARRRAREEVMYDGTTLTH